jgi:hypothetical protein
MKNILKPVFVIFLMLAFTDMYSQIKPQFIFGLNLSSLTLNTNGIKSETKLSPGVHYGAFIEIPVAGNLTLQPGLVFSAKGSDYKIDTSDFSIAPIYIELSVLPVYSLGSGTVRISLFAGPYLACGIGGYKIGSGGELNDITFGSAEKCDLKPFDLGLVFGAGVNIRGFLVSAQYGIGLVNLSPSGSADPEMKNKVIGFSVSSLFAGK